MFQIQGKSHVVRDGVSRRDFLSVGSLAVGGLSLPQLLRAESQQGSSRPGKSVIMVFLPGGPSHLDTVDLKPAAPAEIRGEFQPIATSVPGISLCEHLPRLAQRADQLAIVRTIVGGPDDHASHMCQTGWPRQEVQPIGNWPTFGSVASRLSSQATPGVPPYVSLAAPMLHPPYNDPGPGFLSIKHSAFYAGEGDQSPLAPHALSLDRITDRKSLVRSIDRMRGEREPYQFLSGQDDLVEQAFDIILSAKVRDALDLSREDPRILERYGEGTTQLVEGFNAAPRLNRQFLIARRLAEAGARVITLAFGAYDWHEGNFTGHKQQLPYLDQALAALLDDLKERGLDRDVAVCVWGEFGRTPKINKTAGRDHWRYLSCALLAGGGWRRGQVIGRSNRWGEFADERPVHFREVLASLYQHLGLDPARAPLPDLTGRPQFVLGEHRPISELL